MKPASTTLVAVLSLVLAVGPVTASASAGAPDSAQQGPAGQAQVPPDNLDRIRAAINRPAAVKIENGQLRIYVEVIADWPSFAEATRGYDFIHGSTGRGANPMSHQEFLNMVTPRDMYSSAGVKPTEIAVMAAVNVVGQWAVGKALQKYAAYSKEKQMREIQERIDLELAAIKK